MSGMKQKALSGPPSQKPLEGGPDSALPFIPNTVAALLGMDHGDPNARLCKALIDRITDRANIIETGTESYRLRRTLEKRKTKASEIKT